MKPRAFYAFTLGTSVCFTLACSGSSTEGTPFSSGGASNSSPETGGTTAGPSSTGGVMSNGGTSSANHSGGAAAPTGGVASGIGGASSTSSPASTGGKAGTGGAMPIGGVGATGGATTGGKAATGGMIGSGGAATGGKVSTGGMPATGGMATGGKVSTGGMPATGGAATGGKAATGGSSSSCPFELIGFASLEGGTTGGGNVTATTVSTQAELRACATATEARVCKVKGTLTFSPFEEIRVTSNKTIIGTGNTAEIVMGGFFLNVGISNVIIRNLTIRDSYIEGQYDTGGDDGGDRDGIQMDTAHHVWIDHNRFSHLGDGQVDSRKDTTLVTTSWNIFENHNKTYGIGWTDNVTAQMTIHHNWIRNTTQRNPSTDNVLRAHLFNNFMQNCTSYGNYARGGTNMVLENSVFDTVNDAHYYDTGTLVAIGNIYRSCTGTRTSTGATYSFFNPHDHYSYTLDAASQVEALLAKCAGPRAELGN